MNNFYFRFYYKSYKFLESINSFIKNDIMEWSAFGIVSIIEAPLLLVIDDVFKINIINNSYEAKISGGVVLIVNYFLLMHKGKYKKIIKFFDKAKDKRTENYWVVPIYFVLSVAIFMLFANENVKKINEKKQKQEDEQEMIKKLESVDNNTAVPLFNGK